MEHKTTPAHFGLDASDALRRLTLATAQEGPGWGTAKDAHALLGSVWAAADSLDQVIEQTTQLLDRLGAAGLLTSVDGQGRTDGQLRSAGSALHRAREAVTLLSTALRDARVATSGLDTTTPETGRWTLSTTGIDV